jgi:hypothetical protein
MKKITCIGLLVLTAAFVHGEMLFNITTGWVFDYEKEESWDFRLVQGPSGTFDFTLYPGQSFIGFFVRDSLLLKTDFDKDIGIAYDFVIGPSFIWRINQHINTIFSIGPRYTLYGEPYHQKQAGASNTYTQQNALDIGLLGDASLMFKTENRLFFKVGVTGTWSFLRFGSINTKTEQNDGTFIVKSTDLRRIGYQSISVAPYFGIGLSFL